MNTNRKLNPTQHAPRFRISLPDWADRIVGAGIVSEDPHIRRRQRFTNIASYALALNAFSHFFVNALYDLSALAQVNIYNLFAGCAYMAMHRLHRYGENLVANILITFSLLGHSYVVFAFGLDSNLHVYFTLAGVILFFVGIRHWRNFLILYALSIAALVAAMTFASRQGFVLSGDREFRSQLALQAMLSAVVLNAAVITFVLNALSHAEESLQREYDRSELLLTTILPAFIAERLKRGGDRIADRHETASVLFTDLVGFTPAAARARPEEVVDYLHRLFSRFDALCEQLAVDKIKTIGDSYMAVGGLRGDGRESVEKVGRLALAMREAVAGEALAGQVLAMRAGIHFGAVVAGVIGDRRIAYDVWGDTVNLASRLESSGAPGEIHVSDDYRHAAVRHFDFEPRGPVGLKGVGQRETYFLRRAATG
jgi:adenylate cyclase